MKKKHKIIGISIIALIIAITTYVYYSKRFSNQIEKIISENLPENISMDYSELNANILTNSFDIIDLDLKILDQGIFIKVDKTSIDGIDFATILLSDNINIGKINLKGTDLLINPAKKQEIQLQKKEEKSRTIEINSFNAQFNSIDAKDSIGEDVAYLKNAQFAINEIFLKPLKNKKQPKITYKVNEITSDSLFFNLDPQNTLTTQSLNINSKNANFQNAVLLLKEQGLNVKLKDIDFYGAPVNTFLDQDAIVLDSIILSQADVKINQSKQNKKEKKDSTSNNNKTLWVKFIKLNNAQLQSKNQQGRETLSLDKANAIITDFKINSGVKQEDKKVQYKLVSFDAKNLQQETNFLHQLKIAEIAIDTTQIKLSNLSLNPLFGKKEFQKHIDTEQDVIHLKIPEILCKNYKYGSQGDKKSFSANSTKLSSPNINIYRSKIPPEPTQRKPLYSEMLRKLDFGLDLASINITNGHVVYEEHHDYTNPPGKLIFADFNAKISNVNNQQPGEAVSIIVDTNFMETAPTHVEWNFNIFQPYDKFRIWGTIKKLPAEKINLFFVNNLNVKAKGYVENTSFDFSGNDISASGTLNMDYQDFTIELLNKKSKDKKTVLSTIANWLINNQEKEVKQNETITVERDQTKSFFNYLWLCIKEGLQHHLLKT